MKKKSPVEKMGAEKLKKVKKVKIIDSGSFKSFRGFF